MKIHIVGISPTFNIIEVQKCVLPYSQLKCIFQSQMCIYIRILAFQPARKSYDRGVLEEIRKKFVKEYGGGDTATETEDEVSL